MSTLYLLSIQQSYSAVVSSSANKPTGALENVKAVLLRAPTSQSDITLYGTCYFLSVEHGKDFRWDKLPDTAKADLAQLSAAELDFKEVSCYKLNC